jgi:hypothetical protein
MTCPEAVGQTTGPLHTGEDPEAQQHQEAPPRRMADAHALLDGGDVHHPGAHQGAAEDEGRHTGGSKRTVHTDQRNEHFSCAKVYVAITPNVHLEWCSIAV